MESLMRSLERGTATVAGVLSGTSGDGIDVALTRPEVRVHEGLPHVTRIELLAFETRAFASELAKEVRAALDGAPLGPRELALLSRDLGRAFGRAASELALEQGLTLDLVGSHGQTVWHHDDREPSGPASLQLGDGDWVAEAAGCTVVSDFRQRDLAAGGLGAPISVLADDVVFAAAPRPLAVLNLGGLANLSWLPAQGPPLAFDTGPAGSLLDGLARRLLDAPYDSLGRAAARGACREAVLAAWLEHPFFALPAPKSTGRDTFGEAWVDSSLERAAALGVSAADDLLATAVELVATTVAEGVAQGLPVAPEVLLVAGGGVHNLALLQALRRRMGVPVSPSSSIGVHPDGREALVFATLAARCVLGEAVTAPSATGAAPGRVLGKISPAAR